MYAANHSRRIAKSPPLCFHNTGSVPQHLKLETHYSTYFIRCSLLPDFFRAAVIVRRFLWPSYHSPTYWCTSMLVMDLILGSLQLTKLVSGFSAHTKIGHFVMFSRIFWYVVSADTDEPDNYCPHTLNTNWASTIKMLLLITA